jgi:hypothetical protein
LRLTPYINEIGVGREQNRNLPRTTPSIVALPLPQRHRLRLCPSLSFLPIPPPGPRSSP